MSDRSKIEWTDASWNWIRGCSRVSPGCQHCYAERMAHRMSKPGIGVGETLVEKPMWGCGLTDEHGRWNGTVRVVPEALSIPLRWRKGRVVFVNSTADTFHESVPFETIAAAFGVMGATPRHTYVILTKRARRMREFFVWLDGEVDRMGWRPDEIVAEHAGASFALRDDGLEFELVMAPLACPASWPLPNVILGVSAEDQPRADERIPDLLACPASRRVVSFEPLLSEIDIFRCPDCDGSGETSGHYDSLDGMGQCSCCHGSGGRRLVDEVDFAIIGGESGPGARPCNVEWVRDLARQCDDAGVRVGVKQLGAYITAGGSAINGWPIGDAVGIWSDFRESPPRVHVNDAKGADPSEWPEDLRRYAITSPAGFWRC